MNKSLVLLILLFQSAILYSQIVEVGGILSGNRTFYPDTTYIVIQDLIVDDGNVLHVQAGTVVKVNYGRSIIVEDGSFFAAGTEADSVYFVPNYTIPTQTWKWNGIVIKNADYEGPSMVQFSCIKDAETALQLEHCSGVSVESSSLLNCQNIGLRILNSRSSSVVNCQIENNYNGIEFYTTEGGSTLNNSIVRNIFRNTNHNIYVFVENNGEYKSNVIRNNLISSGNNGIWIDNTGQSSNSGNLISHNRIIWNGGDVGYGLFIALDSTDVMNNLFWKNNVAVFSEEKGSHCNIEYNSFYGNEWAIAIGGGSFDHNIAHNTFSENESNTIAFKAGINTAFNRNSLMNTEYERNMVVNNTNQDVDGRFNFWDTNNENRIAELIYDFHDDPKLGMISYKPYLDSLLIDNPMSPPYMVKKQLVNDRVLVSFDSNIEYDLGNYYLYYGAYENYKFESFLDIGIDTAFMAPDEISIYDDIAVTAHDTSVYKPGSQTYGSESAFAFAILYPFSGNDTVICISQNHLQVNGSNIPYAYEKLFWATSGDGKFDNIEKLKPVYYVGDKDFANGEVYLSLNVIESGDTLTDSFLLRILEDPVAFAGNDTVVIADTSVYLENATAMNFTSVEWISRGDGSFSSDTIINSTYLPGEVDTEKGFVDLIFIVYSECGYSEDTIQIKIEPYFSVNGKLWNEDIEGYPGAIIAFRKSSARTRASQLVSCYPDGRFRFPKMMIGEYYIYGVPDTNNFENLLPGYYAHKRNWQDSHMINVNADVYDLDITLSGKDFSLPSGIGVLSGYVSANKGVVSKDNVFCQAWFENTGHSMCMAGSLSNVVLFLLTADQSKVLDFTLTDHAGKFYFNNLPFGNYVITGELAGYKAVPSQSISLSPANTREDNIEVIVESYMIKTIIPGVFQNIEPADVFPNPVIDMAHVVLDDDPKQPVELRIYNRFGNDETSRIRFEQTGNNIYLYLENLRAGVYVGIVMTGNSLFNLKFVKK